MDYRPALRNPTGVGEYARGLASGLAHLDTRGGVRPVDLTLFSSSWKDRFALPADLNGATAIDLRVPVSLLNFAWHQWQWPSVEQLTRGTYDVAHSLHPLLMPARQAAQVVTIHDLNFLSHPERTRAEVRRDYPSRAPQHAARADAVIVNSHFTAREVSSRLDVPEERITVCAPGAPDWPPRITPPSDGYLLFVGTLEPRKNVGTLLDAFERLLAAERPAGGVDTRPRVPDLLLAGRALPETSAWLDRIARPPLAGRVRHLGYVDDATRRSLYEGARLLVQPSWEEGFGLPVLEAMTIGVPVVAADRGALPEVLGDVGLLVDPLDSEMMAYTIARFLTDDGLMAASSSKGVARARQFTWAASAARAVEAYESAIRHRRERVK